MRFLVQRDYERIIGVDDLNQVFDNGSDIQYTVQQRIVDTEPAVQEEISGYLKQRFDVKRIFSDSSIYSSVSTYYGESRVQYHEPAFSATTVYTINQRVSYNGSIYFSIAGSAAHPFNASEWTFVCLDYQLFYAIIPQPEYDYTQKYSKGQQVWFYATNSVYTSNIDNNITDPTNLLNWTLNSVYSFSNQLPTNGAYWIMGDNRNGLLVQKMVDMVVYHAHATITTRNIPAIRITRYMGDEKGKSGSALEWLNDVAYADKGATLPELPPASSELPLRWANSAGDSQTNDTLPTPILSY